jgi:hypothetical protein
MSAVSHENLGGVGRIPLRPSCLRLFRRVHSRLPDEALGGIGKSIPTVPKETFPMRRLAIALASLGALTAAAPVVAHHSFAAEFDGSATITVVGTLTRMEWLNPHTWIYVDVKQPDGKVITWALEGAAPNGLLRRGLRKSDFPIGSELTVYAYKARNGTPTASAEKVTFADGRNFYLGAADTPATPGAAPTPAR